MYKVKVTPYRKQLGTIYDRQTKGRSLTSLDGRYRFYIDEPCPDPDFWVVQGKGVRQGETCLVAPQNTIVLTTEPRSVLIYPKKYLRQFGTVCTCQERTKHPRVVYGPAILPWFVGYSEDRMGNITSITLDYDKLKSMPMPAKTKLISVITSNKAFAQGHIDRLCFVEKLKQHYGNQIDVFGRGFKDFDDKWDVLSPYKYHIVIENSSQRYYWTEKMSDCLLAGTFPIYYGCTNMADYIEHDAFLPIDIKRPEEAIRLIDQALAEGRYEKSLEALQRSREQMLDKYNMFEYIAMICDQLDPTLPKQEVTLRPCKSSQNWHNLWRYMVGRKWHEMKYKWLR